MLFLWMTIFLRLTPQVEWLSDFDTARALAAQDKKYILLNFSGSDWCAPCIRLKKEVFENEEFLALAEHELILVRADFPRSKKNQLSREQTRHNEALAEQYNPMGKFPYTLILDADGTVVKTWDGYVFANQEKFIDEVGQVVAGH